MHGIKGIEEKVKKDRELRRREKIMKRRKGQRK